MRSLYNLFPILLLCVLFSCEATMPGEEDPMENEDGIKVLHQEDLNVDLTLVDLGEPLDYYINEPLFTDHNLIIEPNVAISFGENGSLSITSNGSIQAIGTETSQILFTGEVKIKGSWAGIIINSSSLKNRFEYCTFEYAGKAKWNNGIQGALSTWVGASMAVNNCRFFKNKAFGIETYYNSVNLTGFENNTFSENDRPLSIAPGSYHQLGQGNTYEDLENIITIQEYTLFENWQTDVTYTWKDQGVPIRINFNMRVSDNTMEIDSNVVLEFSESGYIEFNGGYLRAKGTPTAPILFTGVDQTPGSWPGIYVGFTDGVQNTMEHCIIEYAGSEHPTFSDGIIKMVATPKLMVSNCVFSNNTRCIFDDTIDGFNENLSVNNNEYNNSGPEICQ